MVGVRFFSCMIHYIKYIHDPVLTDIDWQDDVLRGGLCVLVLHAPETLFSCWVCFFNVCLFLSSLDCEGAGSAGGGFMKSLRQ